MQKEENIVTVNPDSWLRRLCIIYKEWRQAIHQKGSGSCPEYLDELCGGFTKQNGTNLPYIRKMIIHSL